MNKAYSFELRPQGAMVNVLWGVHAVQLEGLCTATDVLAKFREVMQLEDCANGKQRVDVYRLVPITDLSSEVTEEEKLVVHLPCSPFDCTTIEETFQQLQDAEIRNERCRESLVALAEALRASEVRDLTRAERIIHPGAKEAWAVLHYSSAGFARQYGGQPCGLCGEWTCAFCEGCDRPGPPSAVCTSCDADHLLCELCLEDNKLWSEVTQQWEDGVLEVTGFHDETQTFVPIDPPLRVPTSEVPRNADGTFNIEQLMSFIETGQRPGRETSGASGRGGRRRGGGRS
eukprot:s1670_g5.t1